MGRCAAAADKSAASLDTADHAFVSDGHDRSGTTARRAAIATLVYAKNILIIEGREGVVEVNDAIGLRGDRFGPD